MVGDAARGGDALSWVVGLEGADSRASVGVCGGGMSWAEVKPISPTGALTKPGVPPPWSPGQRPNAEPTCALAGRRPSDAGRASLEHEQSPGRECSRKPAELAGLRIPLPLPPPGLDGEVYKAVANEAMDETAIGVGRDSTL